MKQSSLFCFVLFCRVMLRSPKPWCFMSYSYSESSQWVGVHQLVWDGVEAIDYWIIFSMKNKSNWNWKNYWKLGTFLLILESLWWLRFNRVYFTIFKAKVWKILIFEWILLLEIQTNCKNWVRKEKSVELSMCSHCWRILKFSILKMWKIKNVFTLGTTAKVTLVPNDVVILLVACCRFQLHLFH
jgi:hypothetical protein